MEEQNKVDYPCRTVWKATVDCPVCGKSMQLRNLTYAHRTRCPGPLESVIARAKEKAVKSFSNSFEPRPVHTDPKPHVVQPDAQQDYSCLLAHLLS